MSLGMLPLGYTRRVHRDQNGNIVYRTNGLPRYEPCVDPVTREHRLLMYELYVDKRWSTYKIARHFNKLKLDGWNGWTGSGISKTLKNEMAIGVVIWNRTRREKDLDSGKWVVVANPLSEWKFRYDASLAIVPMDLWWAAQEKLAALRQRSPLTGRTPSRNEMCATTLFSGTLVCADCGSELKLIRSTKKYKQMGCWNGMTGAHGCQLSSSKSVRVIEECLVTYLRDVLLTESRLEELVDTANACLEQEARKPQVAVAPLKAQARKKEQAKAKLIRKVEETDDQALSQAYHNRIMELQRDLNGLNMAIRDAESANRKAPKPLPFDVAKKYLNELYVTLDAEIPMAAAAIRVLTGRVTIRQEPIEGRKRGASWIATFNPDLFRFLLNVAKDDPSVSFPTTGACLETETIEVPIEKVPAYELLAPEFKRQRDNGASVQSIAAAHGMCWQYTNEILRFADTGERPKWKAGKRTGTGVVKKFVQIAEQVANLRETKKMSFARIARELLVGEGTVRRAYDHARPAAVQKAAQAGEAPRRGRYSHLGEEVHQTIRMMLKEEIKAKVIAAEIGCCTGTVQNVKKQMKNESGDNTAA